MEENKILSINQFRYREKHSADLATLFLVNETTKQIDYRNWVGAFYSNLEKVFDTISYPILFSKMELDGMKGIALTWCEKYFFNRVHMMCLRV